MASEITSSTAQSTSPCAAQLYDIPVQEASCALPYGGNHTAIMSACCGSASVISYYNDCGLFCLAQDQTVHSLMDCLFDHGAGYSEVFCRGQVDAKATGQATVAASASAHVVATAAQASATAGSSSSSSSSGDSSAAVKYCPGSSRVGIALATLVVLSVLIA